MRERNSWRIFWNLIFFWKNACLLKKLQPFVGVKLCRAFCLTPRTTRFCLTLTYGKCLLFSLCQDFVFGIRMILTWISERTSLFGSRSQGRRIQSVQEQTSWLLLDKIDPRKRGHLATLATLCCALTELQVLPANSVKILLVSIRSLHPGQKVQSCSQVISRSRSWRYELKEPRPIFSRNVFSLGAAWPVEASNSDTQSPDGYHKSLRGYVHECNQCTTVGDSQEIKAGNLG